jgi:hypothetical protein
MRFDGWPRHTSPGANANQRVSVVLYRQLKRPVTEQHIGKADHQDGQPNQPEPDIQLVAVHWGNVLERHRGD